MIRGGERLRIEVDRRARGYGGYGNGQDKLWSEDEDRLDLTTGTEVSNGQAKESEMVDTD